MYCVVCHHTHRESKFKNKRRISGHQVDDYRQYFDDSMISEGLVCDARNRQFQKAKPRLDPESHNNLEGIASFIFSAKSKIKPAFYEEIEVLKSKVGKLEQQIINLEIEVENDDIVRKVVSKYHQ